MARPKNKPDSEVFAQLLVLLEETGEKAISFGLLSKRSGLAPATLAQRFGSVEGMLRAALLAEWARLTAETRAIEGGALVSLKGAQALLKALPEPSAQILATSLRDEVLRQAADDWRKLVERAIASRRGGGSQGREAAAILFAAWQGRRLWEPAGGKAFRISDLMRRLA